MKAVRMHEFGGRDVLAVEDVADPDEEDLGDEPRTGEATPARRQEGSGEPNPPDAVFALPLRHPVMMPGGADVPRANTDEPGSRVGPERVLGS